MRCIDGTDTSVNKPHAPIIAKLMTQNLSLELGRGAYHQRRICHQTIIVSQFLRWMQIHFQQLFSLCRGNRVGDQLEYVLQWSLS